jgi:hypothetical protein
MKRFFEEREKHGAQHTKQLYDMMLAAGKGLAHEGLGKGKVAEGIRMYGALVLYLYTEGEGDPNAVVDAIDKMYEEDKLTVGELFICQATMLVIFHELDAIGLDEETIKAIMSNDDITPSGFIPPSKGLVN